MGREEDMSGAFKELQAMVGQESELQLCKDDVNKAMIRHWCEAMEDGNPLYTDEEYAKQSKYGGIIAPPQMVQAFSTPPLWPKKEGEPDPFAKAVKRMADAGYFGIVATTTTQEYFVPMRPGDHLRFKVKLAAVSPEKTTRIGTGHFVTAEYTYVNQKDEVVCVQSFTVLTFKPGAEG
jgi:acyl dehydratase